MTISVITAGEQTQVNTIIADSQSYPEIVATSDGWLVTWMSDGQDGSGSGIYMQRYNLQGEPQFRDLYGAKYDQLVNIGSTVGDQIWPTATVLSGNSGDFVVAWTSVDQATGTASAFQQRFNSSGMPQGTAQKINGSLNIDGDQKDLDLVALSDGGWLATWSAFDGDGAGIYQQRFDKNGVPQLAPDGEVVNTLTVGHQKLGTVTALKDGGWVVTWVSNPMGQPYDPGADIFMRRYDASGHATGNDVEINLSTEKNQTTPQITALSDGGWLVVWQSDGQDGSGYGVYMQRYDSTGKALYSEDQLVNLMTDRAQINPHVQAFADGGWVVTWESYNTIYQRLYGADGSTVGPDLLVAQPYNGSNWDQHADVATLPDGSWVVSWQTWTKDPSHFADIAQRVFVHSAEAVLTTAQEYALGTDADETLQVKAGGLSEGDAVDGGGGHRYPADDRSRRARSLLQPQRLRTSDRFRRRRHHRGQRVRLRTLHDD